jgi:hypothetical protein
VAVYTFSTGIPCFSCVCAIHATRAAERSLGVNTAKLPELVKRPQDISRLSPTPPS